MSAGKQRYAVFSSAFYGKQVQKVCMPVARRADPGGAFKEAVRLVTEWPGSVSVILGPDGHRREVTPDTLFSAPIWSRF